VLSQADSLDKENTMYVLEDMLKMLPEGQWRLEENEAGGFWLVDPEENMIEFNDSLPAVQRKLYLDLFAQMVNRVPYLLHDLTMERNRSHALIKELRHTKGRVRESYERGVRDSAGVVESVQVNTPTARDALVTASESLIDLISID